MPKPEIPIQSYAQVINFPEPPPRKLSDLIGAYKGWCYSAINLIAQNVAMIDLRLFRVKKGKGGKTEAEDITDTGHESLSLLHECNPFMTFNQMLQLRQVYIETVGNSFWFVARGEDNRPQQIWPLRPDWIKIVTSKDTFISGYKYGPSGEVSFKPEEVIQFSNPNPVNAFWGKGPVQAMAMQVDIDDFSDEWNRNFFFNSALPAFAVLTEAKMGEEDRKRFLEEFQTKFGGRKNAHKTIILSGGKSSVQPLTQAKGELDFNNSKAFLRDQILSALHVSKANLGITEDVNRATQEATDARLQAVVIKPRMLSLATTLNEFYLRRYWPDEDLFFDFEDPVPEDVEKKLKIYASGLGSGGGTPWMTINEVRAEEGRPPLDGADAIYLPMLLSPTVTTPGEGGEKGAKTKQFLELPIIGKVHEKERKFVIPIPPKRLAEVRGEQIEKGLKPILFKIAELIIKEGMEEKKGRKKKSKEVTLSEEKQEEFWKAMIVQTDIWEDREIDLLRQLFGEQKEDVLRRLKEGKEFAPVRSKAFSVFPPIREEIKRWIGVLSPLLRAIVQDRGRQILSLVGRTDQELDTTTIAARRFLEREGLAYVTSVNETTRNALRETLAEGFGKGEGIPKLAKRVEEVYSAATGSRARMISRTEVLRADNWATREAYAQSKVVKKIQWLTAFDERTCDLCEGMNGEVVGVDEDFRSPVGNISEPTDIHPNCRCTEIPVFE